MPCFPVQHLQQLLGELQSGEFSAQNWPLRRAVDKLKDGHPTGAVEMVLNHFEITCCGRHRPNRVVFFVSRSSSTISAAQPVLKKLILRSATRFLSFLYADYGAREAILRFIPGRMTNNPRLLATSGPQRALGSREARVVLTKIFDLSRPHLSMYEIVKWFLNGPGQRPSSGRTRTGGRKQGFKYRRKAKRHHADSGSSP